MAGTLKPVDTQKINAQFNGTLSVTDGGAFMYDQASILLEVLDDRFKGVSRRFEDPYAFLDRCAYIGTIIWRIDRGKESDVNPKGPRGFLTAFTDFLSKMIWAVLVSRLLTVFHIRHVNQST